MRALAVAALLAGASLAPPALSASIAPSIAPYERGTFASVRAAHAGRPLIVHYWSMTCIPCLAEMPRLSAYARSRDDFDLVLVATDPLAQKERIASRLEKFGFSDKPTFAYADTFEERLHFEVDRTWRGELPFTALIDTRGSVTTIKGELDPETLTNWLGETVRRP